MSNFQLLNTIEVSGLSVLSDFLDIVCSPYMTPWVDCRDRKCRMKLTADKHPNPHLVLGCGCINHGSKRFLAVINDVDEQRQPALHIVSRPDELQLALVGLHMAELCLGLLQDLLSCCNAVLQQAQSPV